MTTHKKDTLPKPTTAGDANITEFTSTGLAPSHEQMTAYLYGLLTEEESALIEQRVEESEAYRDAMASSKQAQALFAHWEDVPAPVGLAERVLEHVSALDRDQPSPSSPSSES